MIATEARMFTYDEAGAALGFKHKHRAKTVARLVANKGLVATDYGYRTKRISELDLQKFKNGQRALERAHKIQR